jgi:hypothetical protein
MRVAGGRGGWCLSASGAGENKRWDGQGEGWCLGCGWDMVVVVYVGETVHVRASQLHAPTHHPPRLRSDVMRNEYRVPVLVRVSSRQREALDAGCDAAEEEDPPN